jgi:hypothetical protein
MTNIRCSYKKPGQRPEDNNPWLKGAWLGLFQEGSLREKMATFSYIVPDGNDSEIVKIHDVRLIRLNISEK